MKHDNNIFRNHINKQDWFVEDEVEEKAIAAVFEELVDTLDKAVKKKKRNERLFIAAQAGVALAITVGVAYLDRRFR